MGTDEKIGLTPVRDRARIKRNLCQAIRGGSMGDPTSTSRTTDQNRSPVRPIGCRAQEGATKDGPDGLPLSEINCNRLQPITGTGKLHLGPITLLDLDGCAKNLDEEFEK
jgi:hypothetical protein